MVISRFFKRVLIFLLVVVGILLLLVLPQKVDPNQKLQTRIVFDFPDTLTSHKLDGDSIGARLGDQKGFDEKFRLAEQIALSAYPELKDVAINFVLTDGGAPMESNFQLLTLFGDRKNRVYEVRLNDANESIFSGILMRDLPFNAQVGIISHELGHVLYYEGLSTLQIAKWGLMYLVSLDFRSTHEKSTDLMAINRGFGSQLYQYAWFVRYAPQNIENYKKWSFFMDKFYLSDEEVMNKWKTIEAEGRPIHPTP